MDLALPRLLLFEPALARAPRPAQRATIRVESERRLFCAACRHPVTHVDARATMRAAHEHMCTNPHGVTFRIGCFRSADGCRAAGPGTVEHTWFPGYAWQIAVCAHCAAHLGWRFAAAQDVFYGLILDRLTAAGAAGT